MGKKTAEGTRQQITHGISKTYVTTQDEYKNTHELLIMSLNARSINNKFQKIRDIVHDLVPSVLCIQETWGKNSTTDYSIKGFHKPIFKVRNAQGMNAGGGVAIWVKDSIAFTEIKSPFVEKEIDTIAISLPGFKISIINVYQGLGNAEAAITKLTDFVDSIKTGDDKAIVGDFNIDLLADSKDSDVLTTAIADRGFKQIINMPTRITENSITLIDHSFVRLKKITSSAIIAADISDHSVTLTSFDRVQVESRKQKVTKRWLTNEDYMHIKLFLREEKWASLYDMDINSATSYLIDKINEIMDIFSPVKTKEMSTRPINQWKTQVIAISLKSANKQYRQYSKDKSNVTLKESYKQYRNILDKVIRTSKDSYYSARIASAGTDGRQLWAIIN